MQFPIKPDPKKEGENDKPGGSPPPRFRIPGWAWLLFWVLVLGWSLFRAQDVIGGLSSQSQPIEIPYSVFYQQVTADNVRDVVLQDTTASGEFKQAFTWPAADSPEATQGLKPQTSGQFTTTLLPVDDPALTQALRDHNVTVVAQNVQPSPILLFLVNWGPLLLLLGFFIWSARRGQRQMSNVFGFGRSQPREYNAERPKITFADVAGEDSAKLELVEVVDFLKEPDKYIALGARIPRGVLLIGPPGTGKTLLARAVAGEANVAFFSIAASEFVEMFVGVGASRVRDLFSKAKAASPAIVFIDELDAVGRHRGTGLGGGNDEREQTLNQLLVEMDGFDQFESIIVMAATNRPDVLDPALLRPGRFDRQVTVGLPNREGRLGILNIHVRGKPLSDDVNLEELSRATIGFSGADIANLANEAALTAARRGHKKITMRDFLDALDRIVLGTESPPLSNPKERKVVAYHESGHALVATLLAGADPILKVTIVPRGQALGVTAQTPADELRNYSRGYLLTRMKVLLGGRSAEETAIGDVTTGAENDLREATRLAKRMVVQFGMSEAIGAVNYGEDDRQPFLGYALSQERPYSDETASRIDAEVKRLVEEAHQAALHLLQDNRDKLDALAHELLTHEIVERARVLEIVGKPELEPEESPA
jgi:cell division protease FtsH